MNEKFLKSKALGLRIDSIRATTAAKSGHPTSAMSAAEIVSVIFFHFLKFDKSNPKNPNNDRFILSKGHAVPVIYAALKSWEVITDEQLLSLRRIDSVLEGHPTPRFEYNEAATGSLGQGLSIAVGMTLAARIDKRDYKTYVLVGDGELAEGSNWEAAAIASKNKLDNIIAIIDCNRLGQSDESIDDHSVGTIARKFEAFGWNVSVIDGHSVENIISAIQNSFKVQEKPCVIVAKTLKGYGLEKIQNRLGFHGKTFSQSEAKFAIEELIQKFGQPNTETYTPPKPLGNKILNSKNKIILNLEKDLNKNLFSLGTKLSTRKAFGYALAAAGRENENVIVLDADVKNSTFTDIFEKEFPDRFTQCFIAEQNMIGIATGLELRNKIPFASTFACFFTRAADQIRMAGIGRNALRLCGSHAGVAIGEDGPSQMGLEDIALFRAIPNSIVLYPSDAVSTYKLVEAMVNYGGGVSYMRSTRGEAPVIYNANEEFPIGGCKVLRESKNDVACIVAAGVTLHEALKAYEILKNKNIFVSVIDLYSVKPLDVETIKKVAQNSSKNIITVEDHYRAGGIGEAISAALCNFGFKITSLAVEGVPCSGAPEELLKMFGIDADAITRLISK